MQAVSPKLITQGQLNVTYPVEGREAGQGYLAEAGKEYTVGLVVISEWWGLNENICNKTEMLASLGFRALAIDTYRGKTAKSMEDAGHLKAGLDFDGAVKDIDGAAKYLIEELKCTHVAAIGYCMGGALALAIASRKSHLSASISYYGAPDVNLYKPSDLQIPVLANFGLKDQAMGFSDPETGRAYEKLALDAKKDFTMIFYDAAHSFTNKDQPRYDAEADKLALQNSLDFLSKHLKSN